MSNKHTRNSKDASKKANRTNSKVQYAEFPPINERVEPPLGRPSKEARDKFMKDYPEYANTLKRHFG